MKMRRIGVGLAAVAALAIAGTAAAQGANWTNSVRGDGWPDGSFTADGTMIIFRRPGGKSPEGHPRLQLRHEYRDGMKMGGRAYFSLLALDEYDCKGGRFRNVRMAAFTSHNAEGQSVQDDSGEAWKPAAPGTVDGKSLAVACGR
jgi:hypothetical protein